MSRLFACSDLLDGDLGKQAAVILRGIAHGLWRQKSAKGRNSTQMEKKKFLPP